MKMTISQQVLDKLKLIAKSTEGNTEIKKALLIINWGITVRLVKIKNYEDDMWIEPIIGYIKNADCAIKITFQAGKYVEEELDIACMKFIDFIW